MKECMSEVVRDQKRTVVKIGKWNRDYLDRHLYTEKVKNTVISFMTGTHIYDNDISYYKDCLSITNDMLDSHDKYNREFNNRDVYFSEYSLDRLRKSVRYNSRVVRLQNFM